MSIVPLLLRLLSLLPFWVLYGISNVLSFALEYVIGYRKEVIEENLQRSFPTRSSAQILNVRHKYYKYLGDLIVETIKLNSLSADELSKRCVYENPEIFKEYEASGKNAIIMMGHSGNWEYAGLVTQVLFDFTVMPVYRKIKDPNFDAYYRNMRSRFGTMPILDQEAFAKIQEGPKPHVVAMLADQTPGSKKGWWTTFLNQDTPFFRGSEVLANRLNYDVVFAHVRRAERGKYSIFLQKADHSNERFDLTKKFAEFLEREIQKQPENWLWSHKRWKHKPTEQSTWMR